MPFRGLRFPARPAAQAVANRLNTAAGYPRCERLAGALMRDGVPIPSDSPICPCTAVDSPSALCPYRTTAEVSPVAIATGFAVQVNESKPSNMGALNASERSAVANIADAELTGT